ELAAAREGGRRDDLLRPATQPLPDPRVEGQRPRIANPLERRPVDRLHGPFVLDVVEQRGCRPFPFSHDRGVAVSPPPYLIVDRRGVSPAEDDREALAGCCVDGPRLASPSIRLTGGVRGGRAEQDIVVA